MTYPDGSLEKLGEFMYGTSFSPDEKYLAYCTGNRVLDELWMSWPNEKYAQKLEKWQQMYERWETTGRCVWIQKDKLLQIVSEETNE